MEALTISKSNVKIKVLTAVIAVAAAIALPQLVHFLGIAAGVGSKLGEILLPMHLPVLFAALIGGPLVGVIVGAISPLLSYAMSGMPAVAMLPFMVIELAAYGLTLGLLRNAKLPMVAKVAITLFAGRAVRAVAILLAVYAFGNSTIGVAVIWNSVLTGLVGIILQMVLVPLVMAKKASNENA